MKADAPASRLARSCIGLTLCLVALILSSPFTTAGSAQPGNGGTDSWRKSYNSWAVGMVVPGGAPLGDGTFLAWARAENLTALVVLPNITGPDGMTYVVLSAMGSDRTIFQVAAGAWPESAYWGVYSWYVTGMDTQSPNYQWTANSTGTKFSSGDSLSISIARAPGWTFAISDRTSGERVTGSFPASPGTGFAPGDQEVLALESYSRSSATFKAMGNLTLVGAFVDGVKVRGGWYYYSGWDPTRNPLFVVGGAQAPLFISVGTNGQGEAVWGYSTQWADVHLSLPPSPLLAGAVLSVTGVIAAALAFRRRKKSA